MIGLTDWRQDKDQEVTAEFSGAVIGFLMGYKVPLGMLRKYIEHRRFKELLGQLSRIEKVVTYVIERNRGGKSAPSLFEGDDMKELSFSDRIKVGWNKEQLMSYHVMDESNI
jgi:hypothetical protein